MLRALSTTRMSCRWHPDHANQRRQCCHPADVTHRRSGVGQPCHQRDQEDGDRLDLPPVLPHHACLRGARHAIGGPFGALAYRHRCARLVQSDLDDLRPRPRSASRRDMRRASRARSPRRWVPRRRHRPSARRRNSRHRASEGHPQKKVAPPSTTRATPLPRPDSIIRTSGEAIRVTDRGGNPAAFGLVNTPSVSGASRGLKFRARMDTSVYMPRRSRPNTSRYLAGQCRVPIAPCHNGITTIK